MTTLSRRRFVFAFVLLPLLGLGPVGCGEKAPSGTGSTDAGAASGYGASGYGASGQGASGKGAGGGAVARVDEDLALKAGEALGKARAFLLGAQDAGGGWGIMGAGPDTGVTGMAASALVAATPAVAVGSDEKIRAALDFLAANQKDDGSIYSNDRFVNYMTSAAVGAFALARISAYAPVETKARNYLASTQIAGDESDLSYGGFPYKQDQGQAADLSNLQFAVQALHDAGLPEDSEVWKRMLVYLSRVQNRSESNDTKTEAEIDGRKVVVVSGDDGGAGYGPGMSNAGFVKRSDGTFETRSYGSMTYALLKCLLLAGVDVEDARVQSSLAWIQRNFTVDRNPGFEAAADPEKEGQQGYYYYVYTLARTLAAYERRAGKPLGVKDAEGRTHAWRSELVAALLRRQQADGSWVNGSAERWMEGSPILATSYATVALAEALGRFR